MAVSIPALIAVVAFYILILAIGIWAGRKSKANTEETMVAGRSLGAFVGILTMTATWVGGGYINGSAEAVYASGLVWCQAPFGYSISLFIGGAFFAGKMRSAGYITMLDPFQRKYGDVMGALLYIPALCGDIFWSGAILSALGATIAVILDLDLRISIIVSAAVAVLYTVFGGLYSVAYTDVVQLFAIFIGLWLCLPFAMTHPATVSITETTSEWVGELSKPQIGGWIDHALLLIFGGIPWQVYFQRVLASKNARVAQILSYTAAGGCILMALPAVLVGAVAKSAAWNMTDLPGNNTKPDPQLILPLVLRYLCPDWAMCIGLGAVAAAVMSSSDSSVLSSAAMFAHNIYKPLYTAVMKVKPSEKHVVWVMRIAVIFVGAIATAIAITVKSTYGLWFLCSDIVYVVLFPQLVCVLYVSFSNTYGSSCSFVVGLLFRLLSGEPLLGIPSAIPFPTGVPFRTIATFISFSVLLLVSYITDYLFKRQILPKDRDILKCVVNVPEIEYVIKKKDDEDSILRNGTKEYESKSLSSSVNAVSGNVNIAYVSAL